MFTLVATVTYAAPSYPAGSGKVLQNYYGPQAHNYAFDVPANPTYGNSYDNYGQFGYSTNNSPPNYYDPQSHNYAFDVPANPTYGNSYDKFGRSSYLDVNLAGFSDNGRNFQKHESSLGYENEYSNYSTSPFTSEASQAYSYNASQDEKTLVSGDGETSEKPSLPSFGPVDDHPLKPFNNPEADTNETGHGSFEQRGSSDPVLYSSSANEPSFPPPPPMNQSGLKNEIMGNPVEARLDHDTEKDQRSLAIGEEPANSDLSNYIPPQGRYRPNLAAGAFFDGSSTAGNEALGPRDSPVYHSGFNSDESGPMDELRPPQPTVGLGEYPEKVEVPSSDSTEGKQGNQPTPKKMEDEDEDLFFVYDDRPFYQRWFSGEARSQIEANQNNSNSDPSTQSQGSTWTDYFSSVKKSIFG
ncbi:hypothetical protein BJ085DRAFT_36441 [Dimargaris cristalligena]|uniref:Uncharacterized protein n=1 Tax=Dimargaris cristalligena TaxID=215637 RepID=A0A4P9ZXV9_9FUNG|nr:hypothetical protein BJ085DRAFT_36441 [Dimargaris cristalligena]|eukprot:RKP38497.1 hypothetical protein BJ085DRAFT_36441 [Dimargaris cristalligena]